MRSFIAPFGFALLFATSGVACLASETDVGQSDPGEDEDVAELAAPLTCAPLRVDGNLIPFGSHPQAYASGSILPSNRTRAQLDAATAAFYDQWKSRYLKRGCGTNRAYVATGMSDSKTVSEAHGFGMVILAFMAGHDSQAHARFDDMYRYFTDHPSANSPDLMAWSQDSQCRNNQGPDSATDGDLDIAYALLLADRQWGSAGSIDYKKEAKRVIKGIKGKEVSRNSRWTLLGDWADSGDFYNSTRTSDFMPGHFVSFGNATNDASWTTLNDGIYDVVAKIQANYSSSTGLLPDFVQNPPNAKPARAGFLEGPNDGAYSWNACRDPWRLGVHFLVTGDARAKTAMQKLNGWIKSKTNRNPAKIRAGYKLNGNPLGDSNYLTMAFAAPFGVSAMVDSSNQQWLNDLWSTVEGFGIEGYYEDSIKMLTMIAMSGNWWTPESGPQLCAD